MAHEDKVQTSTEKSSIGSVSLGEGGFMSHTADLSDNVETVTSHKAQLRFERQPSVHNLFFLILGESEIIAALNQTSCYAAPRLFLFVLNRVSQILVVKVNQFEFFTPKSEGGAEFRGLSTTMIPAFEDDDFPNFVLLSSTQPPVLRSLQVYL